MDAPNSTVLLGFGGPAWRLATFGFDADAGGEEPASPAPAWSSATWDANPVLYAGSAESRTITLRDRSGRAMENVYAGDESASAVVWSGDDRPALFTPDVAWDDADAATLTVTFAESDTADLGAGKYPILLDVAGKKGRIGFVEILASPGTATAPTAYATYDGMLRKGGDWLPKLQGETTQSAYIEDRHDALEWTHRQVMSRVEAYLWRYGAGYYGDPEAATLLDAVVDAEGDSVDLLHAARLAIIEDALATGTALTNSDTIRTANEHYAVAMVLRRPFPGKDDRDAFSRMAGWHEAKANRLLSCATFGVAIETEAGETVNLRLGPI